MLPAATVAQQLGLSRRAVYDLADRGILPCYRLGVGRGAVRFDPADVEAYKRSKAPAEPERMPLTARSLRQYERIRRAAVAVGATDLPLLTPDQQAIADSRYRRMILAPWADSRAVRAIYAEARRISRETGVPHHVDHIIPLQGEYVSGLHVETNLRIVEGAENLRKGNRLEP
ncbi:MAG: Burkholderia phage Mica [Pseudomonadota bacterium]